MALPENDLDQIAQWAAARRAVRITENLLRDDPKNVALQTRLRQLTQAAEEADHALKALVRVHGLTQVALQEHLRRAARP